jgi:hypothetical protein
MWGFGVNDAVLHFYLENENGSSNGELLIYTHLGIPAYMGMASGGLSLQWNTIDDGERAEGLPTTVMIFEVLARQQSIEQSLQYVQSVPRTCPNAFVFGWDQMQNNGQVSSIEVSPQHMTVINFTNGHTIHANNVLWDYYMWLHEIRDNEWDAGHKTIDRIRTAESVVSSCYNNPQCGGGNNGPNGWATLRTALTTPPVLNNDTLTTLSFCPAMGMMQIWFLLDPPGVVHEYAFTETPMALERKQARK